MSAQTDQPDPRKIAVDPIAGLLATASLFLGLGALVYEPVKIASIAFLFGIVAAGMTTKYSKLAAAACIMSGIGFIGGTVVAIVTSNQLW